MATKRRLGVAVHELGGRKEPLLLLLHANGFHGRVFLPMLPVLAPHFRCVALDLPGHGSAPTPEGPFTAEDLVGAVRDYVVSQGIKECYCFGHSLGGGMAALLQFERPQTFRAMFLFEPVIRPFKEVHRGREQRPLPPQTLIPGGGEGGSAAILASASVDSSSISISSSGHVGAGTGGGCGPSPSLVSEPSSFSSSPVSGAARSGSLLARLARKRQAVYPSLKAAMTSLGAKPPFSTFHPQALHAYLACGGLRPLETAGKTTTAPATSTAPPTAAAEATAPPPAPALTLSCSPENEARVYEALEPPPWRPWQQLAAATAGFRGDPRVGGCGRCGGDDRRPQQQETREGVRGGEGRGCGDGSSSRCANGSCSSNCSCQRQRESDGPMGRWGPCCRIAIAVGREVGLHAQLTRWGAEVAQLIPGATLVRFPSLHHLGPMEAPQPLATTVLRFFLGANDNDGNDNCNDNCNGTRNDYCNDNRVSAVGSGAESGVLSKM